MSGLNKKNTLLKISGQIGDMDDNCDIYITGWTEGGKYMLDEHLTERFPSLNKISEIGDIMEGCSGYSGNLSKQELKLELEELGFNVVITNNPIDEL